MRKRRSRRKKFPSLSAYVIFSITVLLIYTVIVTALTAITQQDFSTYYTVFAGVFGGEILTCALIKIFKLKENDGNE